MSTYWNLPCLTSYNNCVILIDQLLQQQQQQQQLYLGDTFTHYPNVRACLDSIKTIN